MTKKRKKSSRIWAESRHHRANPKSPRKSCVLSALDRRKHRSIGILDKAPGVVQAEVGLSGGNCEI